MINEEVFKGKWNDIRGEIQTQWGKLTDSELDKTKGNVKSIFGIIQQRYGEKQLDIEEKLEKIAAKVAQKTEEVKRKIRH
jgi:uncharacterized protein YjbJ (UPF0337 family)